MASRDRQYPEWFLEAKQFLFMGEDELVEMLDGKPISGGVRARLEILITTVAQIEKAIDEGAGPEALVVFQDHYENALADFWGHLHDQASTIRAWKDPSKKRGHAASKNNWLDYWDDAWAERSDNGKSWKVKPSEILASLPSGVPAPDRSTIYRERQKRHEKLNS